MALDRIRATPVLGNPLKQFFGISMIGCEYGRRGVRLPMNPLFGHTNVLGSQWFASDHWAVGVESSDAYLWGA